MRDVRTVILDSVKSLVEGNKEAKAQKAMNRMFSGNMPKKERAQKKVRKQAMGDVPKGRTPYQRKKDKRMGFGEGQEIEALKQLVEESIKLLIESSRARRAQTKAAKIKAGVKKPPSKAFQSAMKDINDKAKAKAQGMTKSTVKKPGQVSPKGAPDKTSKSGRIARMASDKASDRSEKQADKDARNGYDAQKNGPAGTGFWHEAKEILGSAFKRLIEERGRQSRRYGVKAPERGSPEAKEAAAELKKKRRPKILPYGGVNDWGRDDED